MLFAGCQGHLQSERQPSTCKRLSLSETEKILRQEGPWARKHLGKHQQDQGKIGDFGCNYSCLLQVQWAQRRQRCEEQVPEHRGCIALLKEHNKRHQNNFLENQMCPDTAEGTKPLDCNGVNFLLRSAAYKPFYSHAPAELFLFPASC